ncbi:MAG: homocysteine S-methyltransferase family protein [Nitriliruptoraceae bacterium]|nr:homocysteine S-methyltransferase family protein [Nitriliruptoraceae bacterium]
MSSNLETALLPPLADHPFLATLRERVLVVDGGMGTSLQNADLSADDFGGEALDGCNEVLVRSRPDVIAQVHRDFLDVGVDAVQTDTFGGAPWVLDEYGLGADTEELNRLAARIAREAADAASTPDQPRFVIGSIGPGTRAPTLSLGKDPATTGDFIDVPTMEAGYRRQVHGLLDGGVDVLLVETCFDLLQVKAAVAAANDVFVERGARVPLMVQFTIEKDINTMLLGTEPAAAIAALDPLGIDVLGMNCATGPDDMREHVRTLARTSRLPISVIPNAGIPHLEGDATVYPLDPAGLAEAHRGFVDELGVAIVGGCCGTTPEHLAAVVEAVGGRRPRPRRLDRPGSAKPGFAGSLVLPPAADATPAAGAPDAAAPAVDATIDADAAEALTVEWRPALASLYAAIPVEQENAFLAIGERANANGSRAFRDLLLDEDWEGVVQLARSQTREGAHVLDVCVDYVGRDGVPDMVEVVDRYATQSTLPLVIDSTELDVVASALVRLGGRAVINSVNLEDGRVKADVLLPLAKRYGAAVVVLAIDEEGQARTADWKVDVCERVARIAIDEYGLEPHDLIFDCLTFPLGSGQEDLRRDAAETLEAIERVKAAVPGCATTLGVSNVSFGLSPAARQVLNSVFLDEAMKRGLDSAIVHVAKILPLHRIDDEQRQVAYDLIHDHRGTAGMGGTAAADYDPLHRFMALFEGASETKATADEMAALPVEERLERRIIDGDRDGMHADLDIALESHPPLEIINRFLLAGMATVGELFASGQMQLPFVLQSAEAMKAAVTHLEPHIEAAGGGTGAKGRVLLATVKGDVHDIGKNLVDIILRNNGYDVVNIGIKQSIDAILAAASEHEIDVIGMSGLLVKSTVIMRENLEEMNRRGVAKATPVLLGGAALTRGYVEDDLRSIYEGQVFYCKDAFEGLRVLDRLMEARAAGGDGRIEDAERKERRHHVTTRAQESAPSLDAQGRPRSATATDIQVPTPPFWGQRVVRGIPLGDVAPLLNEVALFRNQWGFTPGDRSVDEYQQLLEDKARPVLREWLARAQAEKVVTPQVVYGYYPANGDGDDLVVWDPDAPLERELVRFHFPRQDRGRFLNIADFFRPLETGEPDVLGVQVVTMGRRISTVAQELFAQDRYQDYLFAHGFGVEMAEALAELWHRRIREELGMADDDGPTPQDWFRQGYRGSRYSFGYAACPDLEDQTKLFQLVDPGDIEVELTDEFMLHPEQSTSAIVVHHPEAKYFNAR